MKPLTLLLCIFIGQGLLAQITITSDDFSYPVSPDTAFYMTVTQSFLPQEGNNETWNYGFLSAGTEVSESYHPYDGHPAYQEADFVYHYNPSLGAVNIVGSAEYFVQNESGVYYLGFRTSANSYSLAGATGNPADVLVMLESHNYHGSEVQLYVFPLTVGSEWTSEYVGNTHFELSVAAFGLNQVPGMTKQYSTIESNVVGWGQVTLPMGQGSFDALLLKQKRSYVDSVFLSGSPAPPALLSAFGISQGNSWSVQYYQILIKGLKGPAMTINTNANFSAVTSARYTTMAGDLVSVITPDRHNLLVYPNPAGANLHIVMADLNGGPWHTEVYDMQGTLKLSKVHELAGHDQLTIDVNSLPAGHYSFQIRDYDGKLKGSGSFLRFE